MGDALAVCTMHGCQTLAGSGSGFRAPGWSTRPRSRAWVERADSRCPVRGTWTRAVQPAHSCIRGAARVTRPRPSDLPMIARYTHPEMGRIWTEERRYESWLAVETAAAEAMAAAGLIPERGGRGHPRARRIRHRAHRGDRGDHPARRDRVHDGGRGEGGPVCPVAPLRAHLVGCGRHRAGAADARRVRRDPCRPRAARRRGPRRAPSSTSTRR